MIRGIEGLGIGIPTIYLPREGIDMTKWAVVACDQYTSQPEYWAEVEKFVGNAPSTLHMIYPEVYLNEDMGKRIKRINRTMHQYLEKKTVIPKFTGFVYVDRKTTHAPSRKGLVLAVDLEHYDYRSGSRSLIRATEGTIVDRLPPRIKIRQNAPLELPHIMVLIDDPDRTVIEPLADRTKELEKIYDFDLMMNGMHITGYKIDDESTIHKIVRALEKLIHPDVFYSKYKVDRDIGTLLFAVGDGNHSLATAKECWENIKGQLSDEERINHPARYALVEVVNVHDEGLKFEPIHRVVFHVDPEKLLEDMKGYCNGRGAAAWYKRVKSREDLSEQCQTIRKNGDSHVIPFVQENGWGYMVVENPYHNLEAGTLQAFLDEYAKQDRQMKIDYIHGEDVVNALGSQKGNIGFYLPPMDKNELFKTVMLNGALPRKTFSMGEAEEKRFYLECRKIIKD